MPMAVNRGKGTTDGRGWRQQSREKAKMKEGERDTKRPPKVTLNESETEGGGEGEKKEHPWRNITFDLTSN